MAPSSSTPARSRGLRPLAWLLAMLLLPLATVLASTPAHAEAFVLTGEVVDAIGDPVEGAVVTVRPVGSETVAATAETDADGFYDLDLEAGSYRLTYAATGFVPAAYDDDAPVVVDATGGASVGGTALEDNELDPVFLDSEPLPVAGRVVDPGGAPVGGITVRAYPSGSTDPEDVADETLTAPAGTWELELPIGEYDVQLVDETADGTTWATAWLGGATPVPVTVGQGGALAYGDAPVSALPDGVVTIASGGPVTVSGEVVDVNNDPVAGIVVTATRAGTGTTTTDTTDTEGRYALSLVPGSYTVSFEGGTGFADATYPGSGEPTATVVVLDNGQVKVGGVEAVGGVLDPVELTSTATHPLAGTVTTASGSLLPGIRVRVFPEGDTTPESLVAQDVTDAAGAYDVRLGLGTYVLELSDAAPGSGTEYVTRFFGAGPGGSAVTMAAGGKVLVDDEAIAGHTLPAAPVEEAVDTWTYHLRGEVTDPNYDGLGGISVTALARSAGDSNATATTDGDGVFDLAVTAGTYEIEYAAPGYPTTYFPDPDGETGAERARVVVAPGGTITVNGAVAENAFDTTLYGTATRPLGGTVADEAGAPLIGMTVVVVPEDEDVVVPTGVKTGSQGVFSLDLRVGTYTIRLVDDVNDATTYEATYVGGVSPAEVVVPTVGPITVDGVAVTTLGTVTMAKVVAGRLFDLKGVVYDEQYVELDGVTVEVLRAGTTNPPLGSGTTGADPVTGTGSLGTAGVYRIPVEAGVYHLRYSRPGRPTAYLLDEWDEKPAKVTVSADGRVSSPGLEIEGNTLPEMTLLLPPATMVEAPSLTGRVAVGGTVEVDLGTWQDFDVTDVEPGDDWRDYVYVEWFLDGRPADGWSAGYFAQRFTVPAQAGGKVLSFRVTIEDDEWLRAPIVWTSRGSTVPKAPSTVKGSFMKGRLTITVGVAGIAKPTGTVTVLKGRKKVGMAALKASGKGKVVVPLRLKAGKHNLTVVYTGPGYVAGATTKVKVKIRR